MSHLIAGTQLIFHYEMSNMRQVLALFWSQKVNQASCLWDDPTSVVHGPCNTLEVSLTNLLPLKGNADYLSGARISYYS